MPHTILALMDGSVEAPHFGRLAAHYAVEHDAVLIVAIDPRKEPYAAIAARMAHCVHDCVAAGARTSTMLISLDEHGAALRAVRTHAADAVLVAGEPASPAAPLAAAIASLRQALVPVIALTGSQPATAGA